MKTRLFVGNLAYTVTPQDIRQIFGRQPPPGEQTELLPDPEIRPTDVAEPPEV